MPWAVWTRIGQPTWFTPHYMSDCIDFTIAATKLCAVPARPINVAGAEVVTWEELLARIGEKLGKVPKIVETDQVRPSYVADISLLRELLGEPKVSLDEGITQIALHLQENISSG